MVEYELPTSVILNNTAHTIRNNGDFRMVLDCFKLLQDEELDDNERRLACLVVFYDELDGLDSIYKLGNIEEATKQMFSFFNCNQESVGIKTPGKVVDWSRDALMIISAVNKVAGKEIRAEKYVHWWTFMSYYMAIGESSLATVINIRLKLLKGKKLEKFEREYVDENPDLFTRHDSYTQDEQDFLSEIQANFHNGGP